MCPPKTILTLKMQMLQKCNTGCRIYLYKNLYIKFWYTNIFAYINTPHLKHETKHMLIYICMWFLFKMVPSFVWSQTVLCEWKRVTFNQSGLRQKTAGYPVKFLVLSCKWKLRLLLWLQHLDMGNSVISTARFLLEIALHIQNVIV